VSKCEKCDAEELLIDLRSWDAWFECGEGWTDKNEGVPIEVVQVQKADRPYDDSGYWDSGYPQGYEGEAFIVFRVGENYFKKLGVCDSYGNLDWNGKFKQVSATSKVVTVYTFKEL
jgi:hypothetical protein